MSSSGSRTAISSPTPARQHLSLSPRLLRRGRARVPRLRLCRAKRCGVGRRRFRPAADRHQDLVPQWRVPRRGHARGLFQGPGQSGIFCRRPAGGLPAGHRPADRTSRRRNARGRARLERQHSASGGLCRRRHRPRPSLPYSVSERSYKLTCLQPQGPNRHAVFFSHPSETIDYHYERNPADPRISHALTLAVDDYGNVLKSVAIGYQRRAPAFDEQSKNASRRSPRANTRTPSSKTTPIARRFPAEVKTFELTAPTLTGATPLDFATVDAIAAAASEIAYEAQPTPGKTQKRLIEQMRTLYRKNDLSAFCPSARSSPWRCPARAISSRSPRACSMFSRPRRRPPI